MGSPCSDSAGVRGNPGGGNMLFCIWDVEVLAECRGGTDASGITFLPIDWWGGDRC